MRWAFTSRELSNWFPLTRLSHLLDVELFGLRPAGHHAVSLVLHLGSVALLFLLLRSLTGALWRSALAAGLFALHPLRVESVAWAAERKDVLCVLLCLATFAAWAAYARRPAPGRYALAAAALAASLMAKPLAVTVPILLLLLDVWPLGRWRPGRAFPARLLLEKLPLLALSGAAAAVTWSAQSAGGAMTALATPGMRAANALLALPRYLGLTLWPRGLSVLYFYHSMRAPAWQAAAAAVFLAAASVALLAGARRRPWALAGWLWFLAALSPMLGIVQVGIQSLADRYTYLPHVGLFLAVSWGAADLAGRRPRARVAAGAAALAVLGALAALTCVQALRWRSTVTLFTHSLAVSAANPVAEMILGRALGKEGHADEANRHYRRALELNPGQPDAHLLLGLNAAHRGDDATGITELATELAVNPRNAKAHIFLGSMLEHAGRLGEAREHFAAFARMQPGMAEGHRSLGLLEARLGDWAGARESLGRADALAPGDARVRAALREAELRLGGR